jgi:methanogenic corrinoid protein MtbC1
LYHGGLKISKIAALDEEELKRKALESVPKENGNEFFIKELLESSIDLDEGRFEQTFQQAINRFGVEDSILKIIYPFQDRIGVLWLTDHVIPAQEHFTSNIIRQKLAVAIDELPIVKETTKKEIVLFTPEREHHELPLQFVHYLLRKNENKVIYFGSNVPLESIEIYSRQKQFSIMLFHLVTNLTNKHADDYVKEVSRRFPDKKIIMSGIEVQQVIDVPSNVRLLRSLDDLINFTKE